ncbi:MAG TPA: tRNA-dihydrouridine synthase family protein, partial [Phycisphaerales bacterium]|nr:tRNA-dihydrouridine synthase family protein [Phycisphaerales bacterium]
MRLEAGVGRRARPARSARRDVADRDDAGRRARAGGGRVPRWRSGQPARASAAAGIQQEEAGADHYPPCARAAVLAGVGADRGQADAGRNRGKKAGVAPPGFGERFVGFGPPIASPVLGVPLQIGPVGLETNLLLAPIAGWSDLAWRLTCRELGGVGLACTDLLSPHGLAAGSGKSLDLARTCDEDSPLCMQLYGSDAGLLADAARWCADHGAEVVDINMGCPVDKVTKKDGGSKLMCDVPGAVRIAEAVRAALPDKIPLTCKMRLGWDEQAYLAGCACDLAVRLAGVGVAAVTVHGRTTEQAFKGRCRLEGIRRVVEAVGEATGAYTGKTGGGMPVIGNGDITRPGDAAAMIGATGCAGVMIGRGAFEMPWLFRTAWAAQ